MEIWLEGITAIHEARFEAALFERQQCYLGEDSPFLCVVLASGGVFHLFFSRLGLRVLVLVRPMVLSFCPVQ